MVRWARVGAPYAIAVSIAASACAESSWPMTKTGVVVIVEEEGARAFRGQVGFTQEGHVGRLGMVAQIALDHLGREALVSQAGIIVTLARPSQVNQGRELQGRHDLKIGRRGARRGCG